MYFHHSRKNRAGIARLFAGTNGFFQEVFEVVQYQQDLLVTQVIQDCLLEIASRGQLDSQISGQCRKQFVDGVQLGQRNKYRAVLISSLQRIGKFKRKSCLAYTPGSQDSHQTDGCVLEKVKHSVQFRLPANERRKAAGQLPCAERGGL
jgi:hypothetical protein